MYATTTISIAQTVKCFPTVKRSRVQTPGWLGINNVKIRWYSNILIYSKNSRSLRLLKIE